MKRPALLRAIWLLGGISLLLGAVRDRALDLLPKPRELPRHDGATGRPWITGDFLPVQGLQMIAAGPLPSALHHATSWLGGDAAQGRAETAWFRASRPLIHVGVAGYPQRPSVRVWAEFRSTDDSITRFDCGLPDPGEQWSLWAIPRPADATAVRIVAEDRSSETFGWVAITHPFRVWPGWVTALDLPLVPGVGTIR